MNLRLTKASVAALGLALAVSGVGAAVAASGHRDDPADPSDWYEGGNATVADPNHQTDVALKLYGASGAEAVTGSTTAPLATYAAAATPLRTGDNYATLFVALPQKGTAQGAWPAVQLSGTGQFAGAGAETVPTGPAGKAFVRTAGGYSLADVIEAFPNAESAADSFVGVYELRLRTSSATGGVSDDYAATYVKVDGNTWTVTTQPVLGGDAPDPDPVGTTTTPTWPSKITYGTVTKVDVTVSPATGTAKPTGSVRLVYGTKTLSTATLSAAGTASLPVAKTALAPGSRALKVVYAGVEGEFVGSQAAKTYAVAKARTGKPTYKATKAPTARAAGKASVTVPTGTGLTKATGKAVITLKKGSSTKKVSVKIASGKGTATLPKLPAGTWTVSVTYQGSAYYLTSTSKSYKLAVKSK